MKKPMLRAVLLLQMVADTIVALVLFMWPWTAAKLGTAWVEARAVPLAQFAGVLVGLAAATCWAGFREPLQTVTVARMRGHANWIAAVLLLTHVFILKIDAGVDSRLLMAGLGAVALMFAAVELVLAGHLTVRDALERHRFAQWLRDHPELEETTAPGWERREPIVDQHLVTGAGLTAAAADWRREPVIGGIAAVAAAARGEPVIAAQTSPQAADAQPVQPAQSAPQPAAEPSYPPYVRATPQPKSAASVSPAPAPVPAWDFAPDPEPQPQPVVAEVAATPRSFAAYGPDVGEPATQSERQGWLRRFLSYF